MTAVTLREARTAMFQELGLDDGGYTADWVKLKAGPIPFAIPNTAGRRRAVPLHDLHHILTGYKTDWTGEWEIAAFEVASSCRDFTAAWVLNLSGMGGGFFLAPRRTFRAFVRGRACRNLYWEGYREALLDETVDGVKRRIGLDGEPPRPTLADVAAYLGYSVLGILVGGAFFVAPLLFVLAAVVWAIAA